MKVLAMIDSVDGPVKLSPESLTRNNSGSAASDHVVAIPSNDVKNFIKDIAVLFQSKLVGVQDKLIGAVISNDRILYCGKRQEWKTKLECFATVPFAVELIRSEERVWLNPMPVSQVKRIGNKTTYGMTYGDAVLNYEFLQLD